MKFEILTSLGFMVRTSEKYWQRLIIKHPDIEELEELILFPAVSQLPHQDKLRLIHFLPP